MQKSFLMLNEAAEMAFKKATKTNTCLYIVVLLGFPFILWELLSSLKTTIMTCLMRKHISSVLGLIYPKINDLISSLLLIE